jgi:hypothetical protein
MLVSLIYGGIDTELKNDIASLFSIEILTT